MIEVALFYLLLVGGLVFMTMLAHAVCRWLMRHRTPRERMQRERLARWVGAPTSRPHDVANAAAHR